MKAVKLFAFLILIFAILVSVAVTEVFAADSTQYLYVSEPTTMLTTISGDASHVTVPTGYYLLTTGANPDYYYIEVVNAQYSKCNIIKTEISADKLISAIKSVSVSALYLQKNQSSTPINLTGNQTLNVIAEDLNWYTVIYNNQPHYAPKTNASTGGSASVAKPDDTTNTAPQPSNSLLRVILIIGIAIPAVVIAILIFKPGKSRAYYENSDRYSDDDDDTIYRN